MDKLKIKITHLKNILNLEIRILLRLLGLRFLIARSIELKNKKKEYNIAKDIDEQRRSIVVLPNIPWSYRWQRPQQIFTRLAKKGFNVFYLSPITSREEYISEISSNIYEVHVKSSVEGNVLRDFHLDESATSEFLKSLNFLLGRYIKKESFLFVLHPVWTDIAISINNSKKIYDLMDLYSGFPDARKELILAEEEMMKNSDMVITTANKLHDFAKSLNKKVHIVRNGSDFDMFSKIKKNGNLDGFKGNPIIGYFGAITDWVDFDLIEYLVRENMDKNFIFIGAIGTRKVRKLYKYKNVYFLGEIKYQDLSGYLAYFNVCLIPFILNDLIKNTNPVKFYEYISSGKPVVSVRLPELEKYSDICYLSKNKEEFSKNIFEALHEKNEKLIKERENVAKENSWDARVEDLVKHMNSL